MRWASLLLGALPAIAALVNALWPSESRQIGHRLKRHLEAVEAMEEGEGRDALRAAADKMARQLAYAEERRLRRRLDGASLFAVVLITAAAFALTLWLWPMGYWWTTTIVVLADGFVALLFL